MRLTLLIILLCNMLITLAQSRNTWFSPGTEASVHFFSQGWKNPALMAQYPFVSYTEVSVGHYNTRAEELYLVQEGDQLQVNRFKVHSYIKDQNKYYYGNAGYSKGVKSNQNWVSTSDYTLLKPYYVADTIGGDLHTEQYLFSGGYVYSWNKTTIGIHGKYTADTQFRQLDPRPVNTIYNLEVSLGVGYHPAGKYMLGLYISMQNYAQESDVRSFSEGSVYQPLYMRGFGFTDAYFSDITQFNVVNYMLKGYEFAVNILPQNEQNGWFVNTNWFKSKIVQEASSSYQTISENNISTIGFESGYKWVSPGTTKALKLKGNAELRKGSEFNYSAGGQHINTLQLYDQDKFSAQLMWFSTVQGNKLDYYYRIGADCKTYKATCKSPFAMQTYTILKPVIEWGGSVSLRQFAVALIQEVNYHYTVRTQLELNKQAFDRANEEMLKPNHIYHTANRTLYHVGLRIDYHLKKKQTLFIRSDYKRINYTNYQATNYYAIACGVVLK